MREVIKIKVGELITLLQKYDPELEVLAETGDGSRDIKGVETECGVGYMWVLLLCTGYPDLKP